MSDCTDDCDLASICSQRHWSIYWLIILCSLLFVTGRIMTVGGNEESPFFSANDRSRWAMIRSLGDDNTYKIDKVISDDSTHINWDTIDKVQHLGRDGQLHFYSSKPTLLPTLIAGIYRGVKSICGCNLQYDTVAVARIILLFINALGWLLYLWMLGQILECIQIRDWSRYYIVTAAGFGTFLSTFAITLNNHLPAAFCVMASVFGLIQIVNKDNRSGTIFAMTGLTAAFAAANELPALLWLAWCFCICLYKSPTKFATAFVPMTLLVALGFFATNYAAHNDWRPPYAHKNDGKVIASIDGQFGDSLNQSSLPDAIKKQLDEFDLVAPKVSVANWPFDNDPDITRWKIRDINDKQFTIVSNAGNDLFKIHEWNNWYDYDQSYWTSDKKSAIDRGQKDSISYLFHVVFGHHGILSLTPIWLFSLAGSIALIWMPRLRLSWLAISTIVVSCIVIGFYSFWVPAHDRNYGGFSSAFRWAFWLAPLWLVCMSPIVDWLGKTKRGRAVCIILLLISAISALYSAENPWTHPWLYEIWDSTGLPK